MIYRDLPWDSDFFRVSVGALTVEAGDTEDDLVSALSKWTPEVCYIFTPYRSGAVFSECLKAVGAKCYDRKTVFSKPLTGTVSVCRPVEVVEVFSKDFPECEVGC